MEPAPGSGLPRVLKWTLMGCYTLDGKKKFLKEKKKLRNCWGSKMGPCLGESFHSHVKSSRYFGSVNVGRLTWRNQVLVSALVGMFQKVKHPLRWVSWFFTQKSKNSVNFYTVQQHPNPRGLGAFLYTLVVTLFSCDKDLGFEWNHNNNPIQYIPSSPITQ